jgi:hypothetical protein
MNYKKIFNDRYTIYEDGTIISNITRDLKTGTQKTVKPFIDKDGYKRVSLVTNNGRKKFRICRLVAINFVDNPDNKPFVNHIDCNRSNDHYSNLKWVTASENTIHGINSGNIINIRDSITGRFLKHAN